MSGTAKTLILGSIAMMIAGILFACATTPYGFVRMKELARKSGALVAVPE